MVKKLIKKLIHPFICIVELETFVEAALQAPISQFVAIKFTDNNLIRYGSVQVKFGDRINFFAGFDEVNRF